MTRPMLIILLTLALAGLYYTLQQIDDVSITTGPADNKVPRYTLNDAIVTRYNVDGSPAIRATAKALEYFDDESAQGTTLFVETLSNGRTPWKATSPSGVVPAHGHAFLLQDDVVADGNWPDNNEPVTVNTTQLWIDPDMHEIHTARPLTFRSATRDGSATGMQSNWVARKMSLMNDVKMHYEAKPH